MVSSIVVLYEPKPEEYSHICDYYGIVDIVYIIDNSKVDNRRLIEVVLSDRFGNLGKMQYFHFPENIGLCKALNFGMKCSMETGCDWALLMDADSSFITNIIAVYTEYLKNIEKNVAVLAPVHIHDRSKAEEYVGEKELKWAMTSGCLYNVSIFEEIGGFKEELFVDGLDIDYCYKAREKGYKVIECGQALLKHYPAATKSFKLFGKTILKYGVSSPQRYRMQIRSLVWLIRRYKKFPDVVRYCWKWAKVILFFDRKSEYINEMKLGASEGKKLVKDAKKASDTDGRR